MQDTDLQRRVERILQGQRRIDDLDRIFLGLRARSYGRDNVREIGDFVAHRDERDKGVVTTMAADILLSARMYSEGLQGHVPSLDELLEAACANLRIATDEQLQSAVGLSRNIANGVLNQSVSKLRKGKVLTEREQSVLRYLGTSFIWRPAFTDEMLASDLLHVLDRNGLLSDQNVPVPATLSPFLPLYVVVLLHGSSIVFNDGRKVPLRAGYGNEERTLEVKAMLPLGSGPKPIFANVCLFLTGLRATAHCCPRLMEEPTLWDGPLDINATGKLTSM